MFSCLSNLHRSPQPFEIVLAAEHLLPSIRLQTFTNTVNILVLIAAFFAHHFTLAHRQSSMPMSTMICTFPERRKRRAMKMASSVAKAPSRMSKKVGFKDDPGVSKLEKKLS